MTRRRWQNFIKLLFFAYILKATTALFVKLFGNSCLCLSSIRWWWILLLSCQSIDQCTGLEISVLVSTQSRGQFSPVLISDGVIFGLKCLRKSANHIRSGGACLHPTRTFYKTTHISHSTSRSLSIITDNIGIGLGLCLLTSCLGLSIGRGTCGIGLGLDKSVSSPSHLLICQLYTSIFLQIYAMLYWNFTETALQMQRASALLPVPMPTGNENVYMCILI